VLDFIEAVQPVQPSSPFSNFATEIGARAYGGAYTGTAVLYFLNPFLLFKLDRLDGPYGEKDFLRPTCFRRVGQVGRQDNFGAPPLGNAERGESWHRRIMGTRREGLLPGDGQRQRIGVNARTQRELLAQKGGNGATRQDQKQSPPVCGDTRGESAAVSNRHRLGLLPVGVRDVRGSALISSIGLRRGAGNRKSVECWWSLSQLTTRILAIYAYENSVNCVNRFPVQFGFLSQFTTMFRLAWTT
jgi:hypothetical protein